MNRTFRSVALAFKPLAPLLEKLEPTITAAIPALVEALLEKAVEKLTGSHPRKDKLDHAVAQIAELREDHDYLHKMVLELREEQRRMKRQVRKVLIVAVIALGIGVAAVVWLAWRR